MPSVKRNDLGKTGIAGSSWLTFEIRHLSGDFIFLWFSLLKRQFLAGGCQVVVTTLTRLYSECSINRKVFSPLSIDVFLAPNFGNGRVIHRK